MSAAVEARTRLFARVKERLPIRVRTLSVEEAGEIGRRIHSTRAARDITAETGEVEETPTRDHAALAAILARLERIERQVQHIASAVGAADESDGEWVTGETATISGGGLAVRLASAPTEGAHVELDLTLPDDPPAQVHAIGRVANVLHPNEADGLTGLHQVGVAFTAIHDADREQIVRYTFRLQRAQLRERRIDSPSARRQAD